jgi:hypothetical protein
MKQRARKGYHHLPARVTTKGSVVGAGEAATTAATATTSTTTAPATVATAATTVADHLSETGVDVLLSLSQDIDKVASLLGV